MEDKCMYEFTPGQISKMEKDVKKYRPTLMKNIYSKYQWFNFVSLSFLFFKFMHSLKLSYKKFNFVDRGWVLSQ